MTKPKLVPSTSCLRDAECPFASRRQNRYNSRMMFNFIRFIIFIQALKLKHRRISRVRDNVLRIREERGKGISQQVSSDSEQVRDNVVTGGPVDGNVAGERSGVNVTCVVEHRTAREEGLVDCPVEGEVLRENCRIDRENSLVNQCDYEDISGEYAVVKEAIPSNERDKLQQNIDENHTLIVGIRRRITKENNDAAICDDLNQPTTESRDMGHGSVARTVDSTKEVR